MKNDGGVRELMRWNKPRKHC